MVTTLGRNVEDFTFGPQLGKGGFATVYSARSNQTDEEVAIKVIDKQSMQSAGVLNRVKNEVAIHSKLKHSSIVELLTYFESEKHVYLVLELCYKGELFTYLKKHQMVLNERETACVMFQICNGLQYLHSHSILHRDLSLSNILLTRKFQIKIGDFGLATHVTDNLERRTTICGTLDFMAPEIFSSDTQGFYSDIWSLGCIMYILLTGNSPMESSGLKSAFRKMATCKFVIPCDLSVEAQDLLGLLLKKSPTERIELSSVLEHRFIVRNIQSSQKTDTFKILQEHQGKNFSMPSPKQFASRSHDNIQAVHYSLPRMPPKHPPTPPTRLPPSPQPTMRPYSSNSLPSLPQREINNTTSKPLNFKTHRSDSLTGLGPRRLFPSRSTDSFQPRSTINTSLQSEASLHVSAIPSICASERLPLTPINTSRLKPISLSLSNVDVELTHKLATILYLYKKASREVTEIFLISPDGFSITLFRRTTARLTSVILPSNEHELYVSSSYPTFKIYSKHTYQELPDRLRKKYLFALEFVNILRTKTPKLTLHTEVCKCSIMENSPNPDIEVAFQCGIKVRYAGHSSTIHTEDNKYSLENMQILPQHLLPYIEQAKLYRSYSTKLEALLEGIETQMNVPPLFPVSFGTAHSKINEKEMT